MVQGHAGVSARLCVGVRTACRPVADWEGSGTSRAGREEERDVNEVKDCGGLFSGLFSYVDVGIATIISMLSSWVDMERNVGMECLISWVLKTTFYLRTITNSVNLY